MLSTHLFPILTPSLLSRIVLLVRVLFRGYIYIYIYNVQDNVEQYEYIGYYINIAINYEVLSCLKLFLI